MNVRLWINRNYSPIKHWLIVVIGFTLITFALLSYANSNRLLKQVNVLAEQNKVLSQENKKLNEKTGLTGEATQKVVLQNRSYIQCLSTIFANYTHNFVPITIDNLDSCTIQKDGTSGGTSPKTSSSSANQSGSSKSSSPSASGQAVSQGSSSASSSSSPNSNTQPPPSQPDNSLGRRILKLLDDANPFN